VAVQITGGEGGHGGRIAEETQRDFLACCLAGRVQLGRQWAVCQTSAFDLVRIAGRGPQQGGPAQDDHDDQRAAAVHH
jgi:hypothetical protein